MPTALSLIPSAAPGDVHARLGFGGSTLRVRGHDSLACAHAAHGTTVEIAMASPAGPCGSGNGNGSHGYALLTAHSFIMAGAGRDLDVQWDAAAPTTLRLAFKLGTSQGTSQGSAPGTGSRLQFDLPG